MKKFVSLLLVALLVFTLSACGAAPKETSAADAAPAEDAAASGMTYGYKSEMAYDNGIVADEPAAPAPEITEWEQEQSASDFMESAIRPAKLIYSGEMEMETLAFEESHKGLEDLVADLDGYFENKSIRNSGSGYRRGEYTVRVPAEHFRDFLDEAGTLCHVTYTYENADDVSEHYYDTESRLNTAKAKLARLQELLLRAETMEDIITIESAISDTEYTIDYLSGTLRNYDSKVDFATILVNLREVYQLSGTQSAPITFGERLGRSFEDGLQAIGRSFQNLVLWLAYSWFWLVVVAVILLVIVRVAKKKVTFPRLRRKNKEIKQEDSNNRKEN